MEPLTEKQKKVLEFIVARVQNDAPPSQREIADHFGLTQNAIYQLIGYLKQKGYLVAGPGHRNVRLTGEYRGLLQQARGLPLLGAVAAGEPILAEENVAEYLDLNELFRKEQGRFLVKVVGDSMIDEGIMDGDYVVVEPAAPVETGQIAVVLLDDEATVKRVYFQRDRITLKPANRRARYKTRYVKHGDKTVRIMGKVTGCIRKI